jgi:hypothetical protein
MGGPPMSALLDARQATGDSAHPDYRDLADAVIKRFSVIIGSERATRLAANVPGLTVDASGRVTSQVTPEILDRLAREYQAVGGTVAVLLLKRTLAPLARAGQLPLPGILR